VRRSILALVWLPTALFAHEPVKGKAIAVTGVVIETGCYFSHDGIGEKHLECATACAKAGVPLAILEDKTGFVYLPVAADHKNQNPRLMPFLERRVKVDGVLYQRGGMRGLVIKNVAAAP
jgi:hypothetical protein